MSELIQKHDNRATIRWKLLTGASAMALTFAVASAAKAEDADRPTVWLELGGQMEFLQGTGATFTAPFMSVSPTPDLYKDVSLNDTQNLIRQAFGLEGSLTFQPENSDLIFSAGIRYGRAHGGHHRHAQGLGTPPVRVPYYGTFAKYDEPYVDAKTSSSESHAILDFSAGKEVGLGILGDHGTSNVNLGVRFAQFSSHSSADIRGRPTIDFNQKYITFFYLSLPYSALWNQYHLKGEAKRNFRGIGPSLSWNASSTLAGNQDAGELNIDWGLNASLLFGRQKAKTSHYTTAEHYYDGGLAAATESPLYPARANHSTRSRSVTVPNVGGFIGLSYSYVDAKISLGYRADVFFGAMDTGIDARKSSNMVFHGPYASISIGLGD